MGAMDIYDRNGEPIGYKAWVSLLMDEDYRRIGLTEVGPYVISTVWLGLDHGFGGPPLFFETMVFPCDVWQAKYEGDPNALLFEMDVVRYGSEEAARIGHEEMTILVGATVASGPWDETYIEETKKESS